MARSWFNSPERVALLEFRAAKWIGTPFFSNGNTPGPRGGVSCQKLVAEVYRDVQFARREVTERVPSVAMSHGNFSSRDLVEEFMSELKTLFDRVVGPPFEVMAGDLIALRIGRVSHHLGIVLAKRIFIHALPHAGVVLSSLDDGTYSSRLMAAWRPRP